MAILKNAIRHDSRLVGAWQHWYDNLGNDYYYYTEKQQDGKFYGEFFNKRSKNTIRVWFNQRKMVKAWLEKKHWAYQEKARHAKNNRDAKKAEREAQKPVLTREQKRKERLVNEITRFHNNIANHEKKIRRSQTYIKNYNKKIKYRLRVLKTLRCLVHLQRVGLA